MGTLYADFARGIDARSRRDARANATEHLRRFIDNYLDGRVSEADWPDGFDLDRIYDWNWWRPLAKHVIVNRIVERAAQYRFSQDPVERAAWRKPLIVEARLLQNDRYRRLNGHDMANYEELAADVREVLLSR